MDHSHSSFYTLGPLPTIDLGFVQLPTYYTLLSLTYCLGIFWFYKRCEAKGLSQKQGMDIALLILVFGFLGARLFHIGFEMPSYYLNHPLEAFYIWQGGFVFYGGFLTAYLAAAFYAQKNHLNFWLWHDTITPVLAGGYAVGRVACFLVGCCYGKVCQWPWATSITQVNIESGIVETVLRHPTALYATTLESLALVFLLWLEKKRPKQGLLFLSWVSLHATSRILMEIFRDDPRGMSLAGLSVSTVISILLLILSFSLLYRRKHSVIFTK